MMSMIRDTRRRKLWRGALAAALLTCCLALFSSSAQAGITLNLTDADNGTGLTGKVSGDINGAIFTRNLTQPAGSGKIQSFVRISDANGTVVDGVNTDARPLLYDENTSPTFTRDLPLSAVPIVTLPGDPTQYRAFLLDINQNNSGPDSLLSLDAVQIYLLDEGGLNSGALGVGGNKLFAGEAPIYDMDKNSDNAVLLDYNINSSGSGVTDMILLVPNALFQGGSFVYLYSRFGETTPFVNNDGYEEWAVKTPQILNVVPAPAGLLLGLAGAGSFGGFAGLSWLRRRLGRK
jgi:hypothetical protein